MIDCFYCRANLIRPVIDNQLIVEGQYIRAYTFELVVKCLASSASKTKRNGCRTVFVHSQDQMVLQTFQYNHHLFGDMKLGAAKFWFARCRQVPDQRGFYLLTLERKATQKDWEAESFDPDADLVVDDVERQGRHRGGESDDIDGECSLLYQ